MAAKVSGSHSVASDPSSHTSPGRIEVMHRPVMIKQGKHTSDEAQHTY